LNAVNPRDRSSSQRIALSGILASCTVLALFLATILPTNRIFFYGLSSFFAAIIVLEFGPRAGGVFYTATSILAIIIIPNKLRLVPYIFILGLYPIWKLRSEQQRNMVLQILIKLLYLNISTLITYFIVTRLLFINLILPFNFILIFFALQILFFIYDYAFTLFIRFYVTRIKPFVIKSSNKKT